MDIILFNFLQNFNFNNYCNKKNFNFIFFFVVSKKLTNNNFPSVIFPHFFRLKIKKINMKNLKTLKIKQSSSNKN